MILNTLNKLKVFMTIIIILNNNIIINIIITVKSSK